MQQGNFDTVIGDDILFRGKVHFKNDFRINGKIQGQIHSPGHLSVGPTAEIEADIETGSVSIEGTFKGNITSTKTVEILKSARIYGDIRTPDLQIQNGAKFTGSCIMD